MTPTIFIRLSSRRIVWGIVMISVDQWLREFLYLDTAAGTEVAADNAAYNAGYAARRLLTATAANVNVTILLNRYSFFEE